MLENEAPDIWLRTLFEASVSAVSAANCLKPSLPDVSWSGRTFIIAAGKAAAEMAAVASTDYGPELEGLVVYPPGHGVEASRLGQRLETLEAGHPMPNRASMMAASRALEIAHSLEDGDCLIALISGGGSALLALPATGVTLEDKRALTKALLASGASIRDMNCIRQHLSQIKGGRLALAAAPAHVQTFVVSDIPGDDPSLIASGPTLPASSSLAHARDILAAFDITVPPSIAAALSDPANEVPIVETSNVVIVASAASAFDFACKAGARAGFSIMFLGDALEGEARDLGREHGLLALERQRGGVATLILSGGETTVTLQEDSARTGRGGRNLEYLLSLAICLDGAAGIFALACDTDGIDGGSHAAGAIITPNTLRHASARGFDAKTCLENHQSHDFFDCLGDLIVTGPTRTNVNDFRAVLVL